MSLLRTFSEAPHWHGQSLFYGPAEGVQALADQPGCDAKAPSPIFHQHALFSECQHTVIPAVSGLLDGRAPHAIAGLIVATVLKSLDRVIGRWRLAHVGKEILEYAPARTDRDSAATIARVLLIFAPAEHAKPRAVLFGRTTTPALALPVRQERFARSLNLETPARLRPALAQLGCYDDGLRPAVAATAPLNPALATLVSPVKCQQAPEFLTRKVDEFSHISTWKLATMMNAWQTVVERFFGSYPSLASRHLSRSAA